MSKARESSLPQIQSLLLGYHHRCLGEMCEAQGIDARDLLKRERARQLAERFASPEQISSSLETLDASARRALEILQWVGGKASSESLCKTMVAAEIAAPRREKHNRRYGDAPYVRGVPQGNSQAAQDVLARLEIRGLVLGDGSLGKGSTVELGLARQYCIPSEVWARLPDPSLAEEPPVPEDGTRFIGDIEAFTRGLYRMVSLWERQSPRLLKGSGLLAKRDIKALCAEMGWPYQSEIKDEDDLPRLRFQRELAMALGLVEQRADRSLSVRKEAALAFWARPPFERARLCHGFLEQRTGWIELRYLPQTFWYSRYKGEDVIASREVLSARKAVQDSLMQIGRDGEWHAYAVIGQHLQLVDRDFLVKPSRYSSRYQHGEWIFPSAYDDERGWEMVEMAFVARMLLSLHAIGLLDLQLAPGEPPLAFRINPMGLSLLGDAPRPAAAAAAPVPIIVQPNARILALGPLPIAVLAELEVFAERRSLDRAVELELTPDSVYRGQQAGLDAERIAARLEALSGQPLPQNVRRNLEEWQASHERITIRPDSRFLHVDRPGTLDRLIEADETGAIRRLSEHVAQIAPSTDLAALGRRVGMSITQPRQEGPLHRVALNESGLAHAPRGLPTLRDLGRLQRLAAGSPETGWQLGRAAVQRAQREEGLDGPAQIEAWQKILGDRTPDWLAPRIKAWSGHFGEARRIQAPLIELPSDDALQALQEDPRWPASARQLRPGGPLIQLGDAAELDDLRALLSDFGIDLDAPEERK